MAPPREAPTPGDLELLKTLHDALRTTREQLQAVNVEIFRLLNVKCLQPTMDEESKEVMLFMRQHTRVAFGTHNTTKILSGTDSTQWFRVARNIGIYESPEFVQQELDRANASKAALECAHSALRASIDRISRPYLRKLTILDLPPEILLEIFSYFDVNSLRLLRRPYEFWYPSADIKSLRLVCRRFSDAASRLLVRVINLNLHEDSSLKRMEEISRHPTISQGVHVISVNLSFYNASFAELEDFLAYYGQQAQDTIGMYEQSKMWELNNSVSQEVAAQLIAEGKELVATLHRLFSGEGSAEDEHYALSINATHQMYLELLQRQDSLLQGDNLYRTVGSAMVRMPCARSLVFDDSLIRIRGPRPRPLMVPGDDMWESLRSQMLAPLSGSQVKANLLEPPSIRCIPRLIDAVRDAGASLHHLDIRLSILSRSMDLVPAPDSRPLFTSGMQQMRTFSFKCSGRDPDDDDAEDGQDNDLVEFLSACLDTSSTQVVTLDMRGRYGHIPLRLKDIFNRNRPLDNLADVFLGNLDLDYTDLLAFLRRLPTRIFCVGLNSVHLRNGAWRDVLDVLREMKPTVALFQEPYGAECEDLTEAEYKELFEKDDAWGNYRTQAETYIQRHVPNNPIEVLQDGAPGVEEDGIMDVEE